MVKRILKIFESPAIMGVLLLVLAFSMGIATFVENDFGTNAAKAMFYNTWWFELIFIILSINLLINILKPKYYSINKLPILLFHIAFIVIILGAGVTRYIGVEGTLHLRQGEQKSHFLSTDRYIVATIQYNGNTKYLEKKLLLSELNHDFKTKLKIDDKDISIECVSYSNKSDALTLSVDVNGKKTNINLANSVINKKNNNNIKFNGVNINIVYGSKAIEMPFALKLNRFEIERYAGSGSPSSFASYVSVLKDNKASEYKIFMNNVLSFNKIRLYQTSYDKDEKGTTLSVNTDFWGTLITYFGYAIMTLGMILALISKGSRFRALAKKTAKYSSVLLLLLTPSFVNAQQIDSKYCVDNEIADRFGHLWVQDFKGEVKPMNTLSNELSRKLFSYDSYKGVNADVLSLSIATYSDYWSKVEFIKIKDKEIKKLVASNKSKASYNDFFNSSGIYKIHSQVEEAYRKKPAQRNNYFKELIKIDEKINVLSLMMRGGFFNIFPPKETSSKQWTNAIITTEENGTINSAITYNTFIDDLKNDNLSNANITLDKVETLQQAYAKKEQLSYNDLELEVMYNRINIFLKISPFLFGLGLIFLLIHFINLVRFKSTKRGLLISENILYYILFGIQSIGLIFRWYVSGHAPWSNGYESMIFIAWTVLFAGVLFASKAPIIRSICMLFAGLVLLISHLSWMNPEITNLMPVLRSHWLTIHVAVITSSYGFLALTALIAIVNLALYCIGKPRLDKTINQLTNISEMSITLGLYTLVVGSFLGGVWANESWGRYWGWDPKETWSMVTILIYSFVAHMRLIPKLKGKLYYNIASLLAFFSVIMTYLGVNYYLTGLHSYAQGDPVPIPTFAYYLVAIIFALIITAIVRNKKVKHIADKH